MGKVYILGGGPAGLAVADALAEAAVPFVLIERGPTLGGLAQSIVWKDYGTHDLGPHKIFTLDRELLERVKSLIPAEDWLKREKKSSIFMKGRYLPYPPSPFSLINVYGPVKFFFMCVDYGFAMLRSMFSGKSPATFEEDLQCRVGNQLYEALFRPIARKLWGDPRDLDAKLSKGRVQTPKISEILGRMLKVKQTSQFEALDFDYPKGGLQRLWNAIEEKGRARGVNQFALQHEVTAIQRDGTRIRELVCIERVTGREVRFEIGPDDMVFSTLPMGVLARALRPAVSERTAALIREKVILNDLLLVFLHLDTPSLISDSWVFIPDPDVAFHRVSEQKSFDPGMTPRGTIVCCEIMNNELRPMAAKDDSELCRLAVEGLDRMGYKNIAVKDQRVIRLPASYPVFRPGFEEALKDILAELDSFENFRTIGRQGAFNYIGTLDAMDIGYGAARWYLKAYTQQVNGRLKQSWDVERERTQHYPVLD